jgi:hypothetical protein
MSLVSRDVAERFAFDVAGPPIRPLCERSLLTATALTQAIWVCSGLVGDRTEATVVSVDEPAWLPSYGAFSLVRVERN